MPRVRACRRDGNNRISAPKTTVFLLSRADMSRRAKALTLRAMYRYAGDLHHAAYSAAIAVPRARASALSRAISVEARAIGLVR